VYFEWSILSILLGSDHYPYNIHIATSQLEKSCLANLLVKEAEWESFSNSISYDDCEFLISSKPVALYSEVIH
jgi:hypothetical protein